MSIDSIEERRRLFEIEEQLTSELKAVQEEVLERYNEVRGPDYNGDYRSIHSLHGIIGGKNNILVDSINKQFSNPNDFIAQWFYGLRIKYENEEYILVDLMKDKLVRDYTIKFLTRNFYRQIKERTRVKVDQNLWSIWFGAGKFTWGLVIAPTYRGKWTNDVSEIRRANYMYWTVGHAMTTGLVDPENDKMYTFRSVDELITFYGSILKRVSNSLYEKETFDFYCKFLKSSEDPMSEPLLIPEFRFEGLEIKHKYRLDFTILNSHTMQLIGFELSPNSTHMAVKKIKDKKQVEVNAELAEKWEGEMHKRNEYFQEYGITTITFTDDDLADMSKCFETMQGYLSKRPAVVIDLASEIEALKA